MREEFEKKLLEYVGRGLVGIEDMVKSMPTVVENYLNYAVISHSLTIAGIFGLVCLCVVGMVLVRKHANSSADRTGITITTSIIILFFSALIIKEARYLVEINVSPSTYILSLLKNL